MTAIDQLTDKLLDVINKTQAFANAHASDAINLLLQATKTDCLITLITQCFGALFCFIFLCACFYGITTCNDEGSVRWKVAGFFVNIVLVCILIYSSIWNWVGIYQPKVYLAHQIIDKINNT